MEYLEIIKKIQDSHNSTGELYSQLAKTIGKLSQYHSDQIKKIEDLEFELISQKIRIQILAKDQNLETASKMTQKTQKFSLKNKEEVQGSLKNTPEKTKKSLPTDPTFQTPPPPPPSSAFSNTSNKITQLPKTLSSLKPTKEKSSIELSSKFLKKTQPKIQDFLIIKPPNIQPNQIPSTNKQRKIQVNTRIIVDENGFRSLSHKKSTKTNL